MNLKIVSPEKVLFEGEVTLVQLPGKTGSFEILKNHAPLIATLKSGNIRMIKPDNSEELVAVNGGICKVKDNDILVLAQ